MKILKLGRIALIIEPNKLTIHRRMGVVEAMQFHLLSESEVLTIYDVQSKENDYKFLGSIRDAAELGYYTVPSCKTFGRPVTEEELLTAKNFAQLEKCKRKFYLGGATPCVSVFYRGTDAMSKFVEERSCL